MTKFDKLRVAVREGGPRTTDVRAPTYEGGRGYRRGPKFELFVLAVANMVSEDTFYEGAAARDERFRELIAEVVARDPEWVARFIPFLRDEMNMRSASLVMAAEYLRAGGPEPRRVIDSALVRADEPAEILAYWANRYGRAFPMPLKRGVADAVRRLYTERAALKYDGGMRRWRMADVVELVHPKPGDERQSALFRYLLDKRHDRASVQGPAQHLPLIAEDAAWLEVPAEARRDHLRERGLPRAITWERLAGWLPDGMDAEAWEAAIPSMGYMALLRNLRNFDAAGISDEVAARVATKLADPEEVAASRQFPFRFLSAWKNAPSLRWAQALERAVDLSTRNLPAFDGRTLILIDRSGSMAGRLSARSSVSLCEAAAVFGIALASRCAKADVYAYDTVHERVRVPKGASILRTAERITPRGGTYTWQTVARTLRPDHDRLVLITDEQAWATGMPYLDRVGWAQASDADVDRLLAGVRYVYTFNVGGYAIAHSEQGVNGRYAFAGLSDAAFTAIGLLESGHEQTWPF